MKGKEMKKLVISLTALVALSNTAFAGKNMVPAVVPPAVVPPKPDIATSVVPPIGLYIGGGLTYADGECKCPTLGNVNGKTSESKTYGVNLKAVMTLTNF